MATKIKMPRVRSGLLAALLDGAETLAIHEQSG
jgi:hypothetical protein